MDTTWPDRGGAAYYGGLVEHFFGWARERGAQRAGVTAFAANEAAQRFYVRHGFVPMSVTLRATL
jgi:GNAT superfamily N-acetyltransferase